MKILMLVLNTFENDSRVHRTAKTLAETGMEVTLLCLHRQGLAEFEDSYGYNVIRKDVLSLANSPKTIRHRIESLKEDLPVIYYFSLVIYLPAWIIYSLYKKISNNIRHPFATACNYRISFIEFLKIKTKVRLFAPLRACYWFVKPKLKRLSKIFKKTFANPELNDKIKSITWLILKNLKKLLTRTIKTLKSFRSFLNKFAKKFFPKSSARIDFEKRRIRYDLFAEAALSLADEIRPDVIHAHDFNTLIAARKIWKRFKIPYIYDSHELWVHRNRPNIVVSEKELDWEKREEKKCIKDAIFSITVCSSIAEHLAETYKVPKPVVIRNTPYRTTIERNLEKSLRTSLSLSTEDFLVVYVGRVAFNRGVTDILNALPLLDKRVKFATLGAFDAKFKIAFEDLVKELELSDRVFCHDPVPAEDLPIWLYDVDISLTTMNRVCLSYVYTLPNKLFESVQAGIPIIGPDSPEIIRIVEQYKCGTVYRDTDSAHLAEQIKVFMDNPEFVKECKMGSRQAAEDLCWEKESVNLLNAYNQAFGLNLSSTYPTINDIQTKATG